MSTGKIQWAEIEALSRELESLLRDMPIVPSAHEMDAHTAMMGLSHSSTLDKKLAMDMRAFFGSERTKDSLKQLQKDIQTGGSNGSNRAHLIVNDCFAVTRESIKSRQVSMEFILAWGYLNQLFGRYFELTSLADSEQARFEQNIRSGLPNNRLLQRYWHAHWVTKNAPTLENREEAEDELTNICVSILQRRLKPPPNYPAKWFAKMLLGGTSRDGKNGALEDALLATPYTRATAESIKLMTSNSEIPVAVLPPLSRGEFKKL